MISNIIDFDRKKNQTKFGKSRNIKNPLLHSNQLSQEKMNISKLDKVVSLVNFFSTTATKRDT